MIAYTPPVNEAVWVVIVFVGFVVATATLAWALDALIDWAIRRAEDDS